MSKLFHQTKKTVLLFLIPIMFTVFLFSCGDKKEDVQPQPTIASLSISEGVVGTNVTITGTNFGTLAADVEVTFNNTKAVVTNVTATAIATTVPTGATSGSVKVKVKLLQASGPSFTVLAPITVSALPLSVTVNENLSVGALVGTLSATTNRGNLIYSLASQSVTGAMSINSTTGILTVANATAFDFEVNPTITAVASVANGTETATANITVTLNNVIDVALGNFNATVAENQANSAVIGTMNVLTGAGAFAITTQTPMGALAVNATTGQLTVANGASFDFEVNPTITAAVTLSGGSEIKTASVTITLTNIVEVTISNLTASIAENPAANAVIGTVAATIPVGVGGSIAYAITTQSPAGAMAINTSTGQLTVATVASFDFETNPTITATVSATNKSEVKTASVTISITDVIETLPTVTLVAGSETVTGCGTAGSVVRFTEPFFGQTDQTEGNALKILMADLTCGITEITLPNTGSPTATNIHTNAGSYIMLDVVKYSTYYLATYYAQSNGAGNVLKIPADGSSVPTNLLANNAVFQPTGITVDASGNIFISETDGRKIKKFSATGALLATYGTGAVGGADGTASTASFARTRDVQIDASGNLYVADRSSVRKIDLNGNVTTVAGANNVLGDAIGSSGAARFNEIHAIGLLPNGSILVADNSNGKIKQIDTSGNVTTLISGLSGPLGIMVQDNNTFFFTQSGKPGLYKATR